MQRVIQLSDVRNIQPEPSHNWRELMTEYIDALECPANYELNQRVYSRAKIELMKFVPLSCYDEMLRQLIAKFGKQIGESHGN